MNVRVDVCVGVRAASEHTHARRPHNRHGPPEAVLQQVSLGDRQRVRGGGRLLRQRRRCCQVWPVRVARAINSRPHGRWSPPTAHTHRRTHTHTHTHAHTHTHTLIDFYTKVIDNLQERDGWGDCVCLDTNKAFNKVHKRSLLSKFKYMRDIHGKLHEWMDDYLTDRNMCTRVRSAKSIWREVKK